MIPIGTTELHVRTWPAFLVLAFAIGFFFIPDKENNHVVQYIALGLAVFAGLLWYFISRTRVIINDSGIIYQTAFSSREILWQNIEKSYIKSRQQGESRSTFWFFEATGGQKLKFSIDLHSRKNLRAIAQALTMQSKQADIEKKIYDIAEGHFPWYMW